MTHRPFLLALAAILLGARGHVSAGSDPTQAAKEAGADSTPGEKEKQASEKPIKDLNDLMKRAQADSSAVFVAIRKKDAKEALVSLKKTMGYVAQIEKWVPEKVSKDADKQKRFLENVATLRKDLEVVGKALDPPDLPKANTEYLKATKMCTTCHNEFRPKK